MNNKTLIMVGIHKETVDAQGKVITPASIIKIYEDNSVDCFNESIMANSEQIYARRNKKFDWSKNKLSIDDFKGSKGIAENFFNVNRIHEFIEMIVDDGYSMKRIPRHNENNLADNLFKHVMRYEMSRTSKVLNF